MDSSEDEYYICDVCKKDCKTLEGMRKHLSLVVEKFDCVNCQKTSTYWNAETCPCPFSAKRCSFCKGIINPESGSVLSHICFHTNANEFNLLEVKTFKCTVCLKEFPSGEELREHSFNPYEAFYCKFCFEYFDDAHDCPVEYRRCAFCKKNSSKIMTDPKSHWCFHTHTRSDLEDLSNAEFTECDICNLIFPKQNIKSHRQTHTHSLICKFCSMAYRVEQSYYQHLRRIHPDEPITCMTCKGVYENYKDFSVHKRTEHKKVKTRSICHICGKELASHCIKIHMEGVHSEPAYKCQQCDKTFGTKKLLCKHGLVHSDEFKHKCTSCGKGFKTRFSLRVHKRSHDVVKPFQCTVCLKTFTTKQWRDNHQKTHKPNS